MERLTQAQASLSEAYASYNDASEKKLPTIDTNDSETLKALLEVVQNREAIAFIQKNQKRVPKESTELKRLLADVMLLLDGVDFKEIKANSNKAPVTEK